VDILILRDPHEAAAKCSLTPLRGMEGVRFVEYRGDVRLAAGGRVLLHPDGEELSRDDRGRGLLLVDCSWRRVPKLLRALEGQLLPRRLPPFVSAYPRKSKTFPDPAEGLASVEALYLATAILGEPRAELLNAYRWGEAFLAANRERLATLVS
jgi:pre-rRNA-processing protein TSR3